MVCRQQISIFQEINSFGWYNDTVKDSSITTKHLYLILTFWSHHEIFNLHLALFLRHYDLFIKDGLHDCTCLRQFFRSNMITELLLAHNFSSQQLISHVTHIVFFSILAKKTFPVDETTFKGLKFINNVTVRQLTMTSYHRSTVTMSIFPRSTKTLAGIATFSYATSIWLPRRAWPHWNFSKTYGLGKPDNTLIAW